MGERRGRGEGCLYWDEKRQRFIAEVTIGYTPAGKRIMRRGSGKTRPRHVPSSSRCCATTRTA